MLERLNRLVDEVETLNSKLILLIGPPRSGKTILLGELANCRQATIVSLGRALGPQLLPVPHARRHLEAVALLKALAETHAGGGLVLFDNIELLFDRTLRLDPLDLLKRHARTRRVVATWPGELNEGRLTYAATWHPEHQDYGVEGLVPFEIQ